MTRIVRRGFTLVEVMVALAVMAFAGMGALVGMMAASREMRQGQLRQYKTTLIDASVQRLRLRSKGPLITAAVALPATLPQNQPIGTGDWVLDSVSNPTLAGDLSTGAFFTVLPNGEIGQLPDATAADCADARPRHVYCRERMITRGGPTAVAINVGGGSAATVWFRVSRKDDPPVLAVLTQEVVTR